MRLLFRTTSTRFSGTFHIAVTAFRQKILVKTMFGAPILCYGEKKMQYLCQNYLIVP